MKSQSSINCGICLSFPQKIFIVETRSKAFLGDIHTASHQIYFTMMRTFIDDSASDSAIPMTDNQRRHKGGKW